MVTPPHKNKVPELAEKGYISIHIPSDADMTYSIIVKNYAEAKNLLRSIFQTIAQRLLLQIRGCCLLN